MNAALALPGLPADPEALMRQLKMSYARALAPKLIANRGTVYLTVFPA